MTCSSVDVQKQARVEQKTQEKKPESCERDGTKYFSVHRNAEKTVNKTAVREAGHKLLRQAPCQPTHENLMKRSCLI